jgi:3-methyladenine DNA glycosylase AlkC
MEPFKSLFSPAVAGAIATQAGRVLPGFDAGGYVAAVVGRLEALELKARAQLMADELVHRLPADPSARAAALVAMLHPSEFSGEAEVGRGDDSGLAGWAVMPLSLVVGQHGLADFDGGLAALRQMTMRFSAEFAIRHFLLADQERALAVLAGWLDDPNPHVRRLVSEGTRPRLPWAMRLPRLIADPGPVLPLLEALRDDPSDYVRRSVANHLNDISKDHPARLTALAAAWMQGAGPARQTLLRHALRGRIKAGDPAALSVFGQAPAQVRCGRSRWRR